MLYIRGISLPKRHIIWDPMSHPPPPILPKKKKTMATPLHTLILCNILVDITCNSGLGLVTSLARDDITESVVQKKIIPPLYYTSY